MEIAPLISLDHIRVGVRAGDKTSVLKAVAEHAAEVDPSIEPATLVAGFKQREALGTTALGRSIAVPHATLPGLAQPLLLLETLADPVDYGAADGQRVTIVFASLVGKEHQPQQLRALARIARLAMRFDLSAELRELQTAERVQEHLSKLEATLA